MSPIKLNVPLPALGLTVDRPGEFTDPRAATAIKNMAFNRAIAGKRIGTAAMGSAFSNGERVQRVFELQVGATTRLFRVGLTKVEVYNKSTNVWTSVASSALTGLVQHQVSYAYPVIAGEKVVAFTNGLDAIRKCAVSGSDAVLGGSPPKAKYLQAYGPYLVAANLVVSGSDRPSRLAWPDTDDPESWTPASGSNAGSIDLLDDPEDISGLGLFSGFLTVHKARSIYLGQLVSTAEVFRFERKATGVGAVAGATIASLPSGEQIFLAADGLHLFNGMTAPLVDSPVQDELREEMNPAYAYKAQGLFIPELDEYWVAVAMGSDTEPQTVYKYNWRTRQVYKDIRTNLTALGLFLNTQEDTWADRALAWDSDTTRWNDVTNLSLNPVVIFGNSAGVTTERTANTNDDAGTVVEGLWETKDFTALDAGLPDMDRMMRWTGLEVWAKGSAVKVYYSIDGGDAWTLARTLTLTSEYPADSAPLNVFFDVVSSTLRLRFVNAIAEGSFFLKKYQIDAKPREARK